MPISFEKFSVIVSKDKNVIFFMHKILCHPYKEGDLIWIVWYY
jgi:hypothetical protein